MTVIELMIAAIFVLVMFVIPEFLKRRKYCTWVKIYDTEEDTGYSTTCGETHHFMYGDKTPKFQHCPYCSERIKIGVEVKEENSLHPLANIHLRMKKP